ncbi:hypothetical protein F4810DRAFT_672925 [Camillea tinctor]|nr:hypothetical protein F4810DRAFT_672925 [Camillea tinctor]
MVFAGFPLPFIILSFFFIYHFPINPNLTLYSTQLDFKITIFFFLHYLCSCCTSKSDDNIDITILLSTLLLSTLPNLLTFSYYSDKPGT